MQDDIRATKSRYEQIVEDCDNPMVPTMAIAVKHNLSDVNVVRKIAAAHGIDRQRREHLRDLDPEIIRRLEEGRSYKNIARLVGEDVQYQHVRRVAEKNGLTGRARSIRMKLWLDDVAIHIMVDEITKIDLDSWMIKVGIGHQSVAIKLMINMATKGMRNLSETNHLGRLHRWMEKHRVPHRSEAIQLIMLEALYALPPPQTVRVTRRRLVMPGQNSRSAA